MPKNIVVMMDGTWNSAISRVTGYTNIAALNSSVSAQGQVKIYQPGVGDGVGFFGQFIYGLTGKGVFNAARRAWNGVSANFQRGDKIYIFGFSRGAFAARHLAGMLVRFGVKAYRGELENSFREYLSKCRHPVETVRCEVHMLGLFDCVPGNRLYVMRDRSEHLNSSSLEAGIRHFRHAVSKDERRWSFKPIVFENQGNQETFEQHWFPGYHSDVGGGDGVAVGLSAYSGWWMMREAYNLGLDIDNIDCHHHRYGHALDVIQSVDTTQPPVSSDYLTTRVGLRWDRQKRTPAGLVTAAPGFETLDVCDRCNGELFDYFKTLDARKRLKRMGLPIRT